MLADGMWTNVPHRHFYTGTHHITNENSRALPCVCHSSNFAFDSIVSEKTKQNQPEQ